MVQAVKLVKFEVRRGEARQCSLCNARGPEMTENDETPECPEDHAPYPHPSFLHYNLERYGRRTFPRNTSTTIFHRRKSVYHPFCFRSGLLTLFIFSLYP